MIQILLHRHLNFHFKPRVNWISECLHCKHKKSHVLRRGKEQTK